MTPETEKLLERDSIEDVLHETGTATPVMVVESRRRILPSLLVIGVIVAVALGSAFAYREFARLRRQEELTRRDLQRALEQAQREEADRRLAEMSKPDAVHQDAPIETSPVTPTAPAAPPAAQVAPPPVASVAAPSPSPPAPAGPPSTDDPLAAFGLRPPGDAAKPSPSPPAAGPSPFDTPADGGPNPAASTTALASPTKPDARPTDAAPPAPSPPAAPVDPPLPTREETERQLRAEAAALQKESNQRLEQQREDLHELHDDQRKQFLDELRLILTVHREAAGPEIERLTDRTGRTSDPALLMRARVVITEERTPLRSKVRKLREIGVPETVILDVVCNNLNRGIGTRNGPRNRNEVWVKAARLLLLYEAPSSPPRPSVPPAAAADSRPR